MGSCFTVCTPFNSFIVVYCHQLHPSRMVVGYHRCSSSGISIPSWLTSSDHALLKRHVRQSKYDPVVDEVELVDVNPYYAHIKFSNGKESTVSLRDLALCSNQHSCEKIAPHLNL